MAHAFVYACVREDSVYVRMYACICTYVCMDVRSSMWLGITNLSSRASWASLIMGHVKTYNMEIRLVGQMTPIKKMLKVGACGASDRACEHLDRQKTHHPFIWPYHDLGYPFA